MSMAAIDRALPGNVIASMPGLQANHRARMEIAIPANPSGTIARDLTRSSAEARASISVGIVSVDIASSSVLCAGIDTATHVPEAPEANVLEFSGISVGLRTSPSAFQTSDVGLPDALVTARPYCSILV